MGQRPTPFTPKFIPEIQLFIEFHPDDTASCFLSGNKKPRIRGSAWHMGTPGTHNYRSGRYWMRSGRSISILSDGHCLISYRLSNLVFGTHRPEIYAQRSKFSIEMRSLHADSFRKLADFAITQNELLLQVGSFELLARFSQRQ